jgi:hypothetical protein
MKEWTDLERAIDRRARAIGQREEPPTSLRDARKALIDEEKREREHALDVGARKALAYADARKRERAAGRVST